LRHLIVLIVIFTSACGGGSSSPDSTPSSSSVSPATSSVTSSAAPLPIPRSISEKLEAEDSDASRHIELNIVDELTSGMAASALQSGAYLEWHIDVPKNGKYRLNMHQASLRSGNFHVFMDGDLVAELATNTESSEVWIESLSTEFMLTEGTHVLRVDFNSVMPRLDWLEFLPSFEPDVHDEFVTGLWRLVSRSSLLSLSYRDQQGQLSLATYSGNIRQQWRIDLLPEGKLEFRHEESDKCLQHDNQALELGVCGVAASTWLLHTLRARSEDRPAVFYVKSDVDSCLNLSNTTPTIVACGLNTRIYIEPTGYGERTYPVEYEVKALLIIKAVTDHPESQATIGDDVIAAVETSFEEHVAVWFDRMTDGRVRWVGEVVVSPDPLTSFTVAGGNYLPAAINVQNDIERYIELGQYDTAGAFFHSGQLPGGWGWGPGRSEDSNQTLWITVNGGSLAAAQWISWQHEPLEVFVHEPMHGYDSHFDAFGLPLPDGYLHGAELNQYSRESDGFIPWYRDYWLGQVIATDDTYRGYGPRMFRMLSPREYALSIQSEPLL
jgi:hypothetical protein